MIPEQMFKVELDEFKPYVLAQELVEKMKPIIEALGGGKTYAGLSTQVISAKNNITEGFGRHWCSNKSMRNSFNVALCALLKAEAMLDTIRVLRPEVEDVADALSLAKQAAGEVKSLVCELENV